MPFINHTHKFVFLGNARCASTSMYQEIAKNSKEDSTSWPGGIAAKPNSYHMGVKELLRKHPYTETYYKFCFVRNPWDRFLSSYREFKMDRHSEWNSEIKTFKSFEEFCIGFRDTSLVSDVHFVPLYDQIYSFENTMAIDYVARFENLTEDYANIMKALNKPQELNFHSRHHKEEKHYTESYTSETRDIIGEFYSKDIDAFNYFFQKVDN